MLSVGIQQYGNAGEIVKLIRNVHIQLGVFSRVFQYNCKGGMPLLLRQQAQGIKRQHWRVRNLASSVVCAGGLRH